MEAATLAAKTSIYKTRTTCRACSGGLHGVLSLGDQYLVRFPEKIDECLPRAPLDLVQCKSCGLLQLRHTVEPDLLYREFFYRSSINQTMRDALQDLVADGLRYHQSGTWLDIGANDGCLLGFLGPEWMTIACEPARNFTDILRDNCNYVIDDYFSADHDCLESGADVITSAAMFYDLDDPHPFLRDIAKVLKRGGVWINQLNDSPGMLKATAFDSLCHEHVCYYDVHTLASLYLKHGLVITNISHNEVNGGSIRVTAQKAGNNFALTLRGMPRAEPKDVASFAGRVVKWKKVMSELLGKLDGPIWALGASTKFTVMAQYLGDATSAIVAVAERNPSKHGKLMVGSWLPIVSETDFRRAAPPYAILGPWSFRDEVLERERLAREAGTTIIMPLPSIELAL